MRAFTLVADRRLGAGMPALPALDSGEVQISVKAVALDHSDRCGQRGMAFGKIVIGF
jgi:alcohol dehydrogenase